MANIAKIEGKKGVSYKLTAFCGYDSTGKQIRKTKTWKPEKGMTTRQAEKQAAFEAEKFEEALNKGTIAFDGKARFEEYAAIWLGNVQLAYKTKERYIELLQRINAAIGHMRLENIQAPDTINFWLEKFIHKHGLEHFTPHSLRHTFSTLQIMAGVDIRTLQARTGHAQASTLTNIYAHSIKTAAEAATIVLDDILTPKSMQKGEKKDASSQSVL